MDHDPQPVAITTDKINEMACAQCACQIDVSEFDPFARIQCPECGREQAVPARLGHFLLLDLLGTGGMGGVYVAKDETLGRLVAIKVMLESLGADETFVETFKREAQAIAKLNHPNIAQVYSFGQEKGQPYIVMELVSGRHFDRIIETEKQVDQALVTQIALDISQGLQAADEIGLVHGDIKPENILLDEKMHAKLVDFGLATFQHQAADSGIWGTPYYISPEKVRRKKADARSDIYSLGATMYHALAGQPPFEGETPVEVVKARLDTTPPLISTLRADINPILDGIVARMLDPEPLKRYPTYASLISDLNRALRDLTTKPAGISDTIRTGKIRLVRRSSASTAGDGGGAEGRSEEPQSSGRPRIVLRKGTSPESLLSEPKRVGTDKPEDEESQKKTAKAKRKTSKVFVAIGVVILLGIVGVGVGRHMQEQEAKATASRKEKFDLDGVKQQAQQSLHTMQTTVSNVVVVAASAAVYVGKVTNAVFVVEEKVIDLSPPPPPEVKPETAAATNAAAGVATNAAATNAVAPAATVAPPAPAPAEAAPVAEEHEIVVAAKQVVASIRKAEDAAKTATELLNTARTLNDETQKASTAAIASRKIGRFPDMVKETQDLLSRAKSAVDEAAATASRVDTIMNRVVRQRIEDDAKRKAEEQAKAVEAEQAAKEAAHKKLAAEETAKADLAHTEILPSITKGKYEEALKTVTGKLPEYQTDEGKAAIQALIDRCKRLKDLRTYLIERLATNPMPWGWKQGRSNEDVVGADAVGVKLRGRTAPWEEVTVKQMLVFINYYLDDQMTKQIPLKVIADQHLNAAIYCFENGGVEAAQRFGSRAVELRPALAPELKRLLPTIAGETQKN